MCDKADEIVDLYCSLMVGVAQEICEKQEIKRGKDDAKAGILNDKEAQ